MIGIPAGTRVLLAIRPVDFRKGAHTLAALAQEVLGEDPFSGAVIVYRAKRSDRIKILVWDTNGLVLIWKQLQDANFRWPPIVDGTMRLSAVEFAALFVDWIGRGCKQQKRFSNRFAPRRIDCVSTTYDSLQRLPEDTEGLRALVLTLMAKLDEVSSERDTLLQQNDRIRHLLRKLKRMQFGAKSERLPEEQLQLGLEALEQAIARNEAEAEKHDPKKTQSGAGTSTCQSRRVACAFAAHRRDIGAGRY